MWYRLFSVFVVSSVLILNSIGCSSTPALPCTATAGTNSQDDCPNGFRCEQGKCVVGCKPEESTCNNRCVNLQKSTAHCGKCGTTCDTGKICVAGACQIECDEGQTACGDNCVNAQNDNAHCGACDNTCKTDELCQEGACKPECAQGLNKCGEACVNLKTNNNHCGACDKVCPAGNVCSSGQCQLSCQSGLEVCSERCVDLQTDNRNCGSCGTTCKTGELCSQSKCQLSCQQGLTQCNNTCVNTASDRQHCGTCDNACKTGFVCNQGACELFCATGQSKCSDLCVDIATDRANCGACGTACQQGEVCSNGKCVISCPTGQTECTGACTNLQVDANNCGACGTRCSGGKLCISGQCKCATDLTDCSGSCKNTATDRSHCGSCGKACGSGEFCVKGACIVSCPSGQVECKGKCIDTNTDNANCGACGTVCTGGQTCQSGSCQCPSSLTACSGSCVDTQTDRSHCGACSKLCKQGEVCSSGSCSLQCPTGFKNCSGGCVNTQSDSKHCGACGVICQSGELCLSGSCQLYCQAGWKDCNGTCQDLQNNSNHCGACGNVCAKGTVCSAGKCIQACPTTQLTCGGVCVDPQTDLKHCGRCNSPCKTDQACISGRCETCLDCPIWVTRAGGTSSDQGYAVAADNRGNTYSTGRINGTANFDLITLNTKGSTDIYVTKQDVTGKYLWAVRFGGTSGDNSFSIAADTAGNTYVAGSFQGTADFGPFTLTSKGSTDMFAAKLDKTGKVLWAIGAGGIYADYGYGIDVDSKGNVYVTGSFQDTASFGTATFTTKGSNDIFLAKLDSNGTWSSVQQFGGTSSDIAYDLKVDNKDAPHIAGIFANSIEIGSTTLSSNGSDDIFVAKWNASGQSMWAKNAGGSGNDRVTRLAVDASNNAYVVGYFNDTTTIGTTTLKTNGSNDFFVAKFNNQGTIQWAQSGGSIDSDYAYGVAVDKAGNVYIGGYFDSTLFLDSIVLFSRRNNDIFIAKLDSQGRYTGAIQAGGDNSSDVLYDLEVDSTDVLYATGSFQTAATFGKSSIGSAGSNDSWSARYGRVSCPPGHKMCGGVCTYNLIDKANCGACGTQCSSSQVCWSNQCGVCESCPSKVFSVTRTYFNRREHTFVDSQDNIYITGTVSGNMIFGTTTFSGRGGSLDVYVAKYDKNGALQWAYQGGGPQGYESPTRLHVDRSGNTYLLGRFYRGDAVFGNTTLKGASYDNDIFVLKLNANGKMLWARSGGGLSHDYGTDIAVDSSGHAYITGYYRTSAVFGNTTLTASSNYDLFVAKLHSNSGAFLWAKGSQGNSNAYAYGIAVDSSNDVYLTGYFNAQINFGTTSLSTEGSSDIFLAKMDRNGNAIWAQRYGGVGTQIVSAMQLDASGNIYLAGRFNNTATFGTTTHTSQGSNDIFVFKVNKTGNMQWSFAGGGKGSEQAFSLAVDRNGSVYVGGQFDTTATFGNKTIITYGYTDMCVIKLSSAGAVQGVISGGGRSTEYPRGLWFDTNGNLLVTGQFPNQVRFGDSIIPNGYYVLALQFKF